MSTHVRLQVRETSSRGRGVFALEDIPAGTLIESADVIPIPRDEMRAIEDCILGDYYFRWGVGGLDGAIALGYGSIYNHSYSPNARYVKHPDRLSIDFIALKDIAAGEEIRTNYNGEPESKKMVWFEVSE
jgi:uncharacterized protein